MFFTINFGFGLTLCGYFIVYSYISLCINFQVGSVPVLIAMKDGKVLERIVGLQDTDKLRQFVNKYAE